MSRTIVVTGSASGMGAATVTRLSAAGDRVIGIDLHDAEVTADLATPEGRAAAIDGVAAAVDGSIDGLVTWAGMSGLDKYPGSLLVSVNHFGTVALLAAVESLLSAVVADGMSGDRHNSNVELVAQGIANIAAPLLLSRSRPAAWTPLTPSTKFCAMPCNWLRASAMRCAPSTIPASAPPTGLSDCSSTPLRTRIAIVPALLRE